MASKLPLILKVLYESTVLKISSATVVSAVAESCLAAAARACRPCRPCPCAKWYETAWVAGAAPVIFVASFTFFFLFTHFLHMAYQQTMNIFSLL
jgi:hypothetical protein